MKVELNTSNPEVSKKIVLVGCEPGAISIITSFIEFLSGEFHCPRKFQDFVSERKLESVFFHSSKNFQRYAKSLILKNIGATFIIGSAYHQCVSKELLKLSKKYNLEIIFVIDHFSNINKRFLINQTESIIPEKVIVIEETVKQNILDKYKIQPKNIFVVPHPKLKVDPLVNQEIKKKDRVTNKILFISEEIRDDELYYANLPFDEYSVFSDLAKICELENFILDVKLHPMENKNKYPGLSQKNRITVKSISSFINNYDYIIGVNSMLLNEILVYSEKILFYQPVASQQDCLQNNENIKIIRTFHDLHNLIKSRIYINQVLNAQTKFDQSDFRKFIECE